MRFDHHPAGRNVADHAKAFGVEIGCRQSGNAHDSQIACELPSLALLLGVHRGVAAAIEVQSMINTQIHGITDRFKSLIFLDGVLVNGKRRIANNSKNALDTRAGPDPNL